MSTQDTRTELDAALAKLELTDVSLVKAINDNSAVLIKLANIGLPPDLSAEVATVVSANNAITGAILNLQTADTSTAVPGTPAPTSDGSSMLTPTPPAAADTPPSA